MTGIDRVDFAYLTRLAAEPVPCFGLVRTRLGYVLLDAEGLKRLATCLEGDSWARPPLWHRLLKRPGDTRTRAERTVRKLGIARTVPALLGAMLRKHLPAGTVYLNTSHASFTARVIRAVRSIPEARITVMIHDTLPLDVPQFQREGSVPRFDAFLRRVGSAADLIIANSADTAARLPEHLGTCPPVVTALLGTDLTPAQPLPPAQPPHFVTLGTIEPRKNHKLLLDVWELLPEPKPTLYVIGRRGWHNADIFARLDAKPDGIIELNDATDAKARHLIATAHGFLFPSLAEGFGLPPLEAAVLGTPCLCGNLPVYREFLADIPVYLKTDDRYAWKHEIEDLMAHPQQARATHAERMRRHAPPTWEAHFKTVLTRS
ncbi:glycosyltransferase [Pseudaestuariivita sp.]|uniref:glycosyltransferase n=1 Tax=Pseudaestuariivita sp. TaxID=2211669 RepID=UPI004058B03E